ncbi:hypothetical protein BDR26DRAFT_871023 [Obelidium mucronatum]|nr:hypothetical protein BDR26DRAFT_871023 [Obelidium mucronatum]
MNNLNVLLAAAESYTEPPPSASSLSGMMRPEGTITINRNQTEEIQNTEPEQYTGFMPSPIDARWKTNLFISTPFEAQLILEAALNGCFPILNSGPYSSPALPSIQSGTVLIFAEKGSHFTQMVRFRDGKRWSPSRPQGPFLLYREIEGFGGITHVGSVIERSSRFVNKALRERCRFIPNGLAKRSIGLTGSDGLKYRVMSYFYPMDVEHIYASGNTHGVLTIPSECPEYQSFIKSAKDLQEPIPRSVSTVTSSISQPASNAQFSYISTQRPCQSSLPSTRSKPSRANSKLPYSRPPPISEAASIPETVSKRNPSPSCYSQLSATSSDSLEISPHAVFQVENLDSTGMGRLFENHAVFQLRRVRRGESQCSCSGLGIRRAVDYFRGQEDWTERPVYLAPLLNFEKR